MMGIHKVIGKLPRPKRGYVLPYHKYTGPYNPLDEQLNEDDQSLPRQEPYNAVDAIYICIMISHSRLVYTHILLIDKVWNDSNTPAYSSDCNDQKWQHSTPAYHCCLSAIQPVPIVAFPVQS